MMPECLAQHIAGRDSPRFSPGTHEAIQFPKALAPVLGRRETWRPHNRKRHSKRADSVAQPNARTQSAEVHAPIRTSTRRLNLSDAGCALKFPKSLIHNQESAAQPSPVDRAVWVRYFNGEKSGCRQSSAAANSNGAGSREMRPLRLRDTLSLHQSGQITNYFTQKPARQRGAVIVTSDDELGDIPD